jgi:subtilisin family serine protease
MQPRRGLRVVLIVCSLAVGVHFWRAHSAPPTQGEEATRNERIRHLEALGVTKWHEAGLRGAGTRVAVLDTGFRGYREQLGAALPAKIATRSFRRDGNLEARDSNHGVMCAEVVHAIAPDAELIFANWEPDQPETFIAAARWCRAQGAQVVSCSVIMPAWSDGEGGGDVHHQLAEIFGDGKRPGDLLAFACAGNLAPRHWGGAFADDGHGHHRWGPTHIDNAVSPWGNDRVSIELICGPASGYALELFDVSAAKEIGERLGYRGPDRRVAIVRFVPEPGHSYRLRVRHVDGQPGSFHLASLAAWLEHSVARGSIPFPGDGPEWLTIAAVDAEGRRLSYSSCGPNSPHPKPDLAAPVPFPSFCRHLPFSGTSAAAPQAAGVAALVWSRHADWPAERVRREMLRSCRDLGPPGHDPETGFGRIELPKEP